MTETTETLRLNIVSIVLWLDNYSMELRDKIITVATGLFRQQGIRAVTMDDIAHQAGISKKTIYREFKDKSELVYLTFSAYLEAHECKMKEFYQQEEEIMEHFIQMLRFIKDRFSDMNPLILNEIRRYYPDAWQRFEQFKKDHAIKGMTKMLDRGKESGYFRASVNSEIMAIMRMEQISYSYSIFSADSNLNMAELQLQIFDHFIHGLLTDKGRAAYLNKINQNE